MSKYIFYIPGNQTVQRAVGKALKASGCSVAPLPCREVTHLVLPVPTFFDNGELKCGGDLNMLLSELSEDITIIGGNLPESLTKHYKTLDLLKDAQYVAHNAYITACCAMRIMMMELPVVLRGCKVLIIGWGRIAQCLASLLCRVEADVTVAIRNPIHRALAAALGYNTVDSKYLTDTVSRYRVICNTAPADVISAEQADLCREDCVKIELASVLGIAGKHVIWARGVPGKDAPESSGILIAETVLRLINKEE